MNADSLKTELQQVLDNDLLLRKEYNELRRSLSDYRNQLISRDEDCKRLQVTIDVLHTKLSVLDRDNGNFKAEIAGLKEIEASLKDELVARQGELGEKMAEIHDLKAEITRLGEEYEHRFRDLHEEAAGRLGQLGEQHLEELAEIKALAGQSEENVRALYEEKLAGLEAEWQAKTLALEGEHRSESERLRIQHADELSVLRDQYNTTLAGLSATSHEQQAEIKLKYETRIVELEQLLSQNEGEMRQRFEEEAQQIREQSAVQRSQLTAEFDRNLEAMALEYAQREERMRLGYESRIDDLRAELAAVTEELALSVESRVAAVKAHHEELLTESCLTYESRIADLINIYEDKISNLLIHSNASNSRLSEELGSAREEAERNIALAQTMNAELEQRDMSIAELTARVEDLDLQLQNERERVEAGVGETPLASLPDAREEEIAALSEQMFRQNQAHSEYVTELNATIAQLTDEVNNMSAVFTSVTNDLSAAENRLDQKDTDLREALGRISELEQEITTNLSWAANQLEQKEAGLSQALARVTVLEQELSAAGQAQELKAEYEQKLALKELEFQKLLVENNTLIAEIEDSQRVVEIQQSELTLLRAELADQQNVQAGKVEDLKETLHLKNQEISRLELTAGNLEKELELLRGELLCNINEVPAGNTLAGLQDLVNELTAKVQGYEHQLAAQAQPSAAEQEAFIDKLFKQIDHLSHQRLQLLDEKEQMAAQLLKMNEVLGTMTQQVDSEHIDVTGLNNHRKNTILAGNSKGQEANAPMRKQINELVREIDKCIALLSA